MQLYCIKKVVNEKTYYNYYLDLGNKVYVPVSARYFKDDEATNTVNSTLMYKFAVKVDKLP